MQPSTWSHHTQVDTDRQTGRQADTEGLKLEFPGTSFRIPAAMP